MSGMQLGGLQWLLDIALIGLLAATLFHAVRLERALGVLKRDRAALEELVRGFNASTRQAEAGVERLRDAVDGAGRQIARQIEAATVLKADMIFLNERGKQLADRLDGLVRTGRPLAAVPPRRESEYAGAPAPHSEYGRAADIAADLAGTTVAGWEPEAAPRSRAESADEPRLRSQAERDLMKALRLTR